MDNNIAEIKERLDIVQVIQPYVNLKQTGKNFSGLCPFHGEKTPSFIVSPDIQRYKCFGCGVSGDIFNFVQNVENLDFQETLEKLAKLAGVELKRKNINPIFKDIEDINYIATKYYYKKLKEDKRALEYMKSRGFTDESIKNFGVGYAPRTPRLLDYTLKQKTYKKETLLSCGLFVEKEGKIKEKFYDRIMFPIRSKKGKVIGFTGRILPGNDWGPKYMNSPETPVFHKKDNLFGQYESRQEIRKQDLAIICEGSTDVISSHQHNIKNIVAPLGTSLTNEQLLNIKQLTNNVLFFFDSDSAGKNALIRAFKLASELGINPYAADATPYKDIDEMLNQDKNDFENRVKNRTEAFSFILRNLLENLDLKKLNDLQYIRENITSLLQSVKDQTTKNHYIQKTKDLTGLDIFSSKQTEENRNINNFKPSKRKEANNPERRYIGLLLISTEMAQSDLVDEDSLNDAVCKRALRLISTCFLEGCTNQLPERVQEDDQIREIYEETLFEIDKVISDSNSVEKELHFYKKLLDKKRFETVKKDLSRQIAMAEELGDNELSTKLLSQLQEITNKLKQ